MYFGLCYVKIKLSLCLNTKPQTRDGEVRVYAGERVAYTTLMEVRAGLDMMAKRNIPAPASAQTLISCQTLYWLNYVLFDLSVYVL